jgi:CheY-like chemotaxis protein
MRGGDTAALPTAPGGHGWGRQASGGSVLPPSGTGCRIEPVLTGPDNLDVSPTVLIVDDHAAFRAGARAVLEADGYDVVGEAPDGQRGLDAAQSLNPDVVLLDVRLPDMDGFTVAGRLAAGGCGCAIIVTSSSDDPLYRERAQSSGARGFVAKHDVCGAALDRLLS